jgi:hypothetical protein
MNLLEQGDNTLRFMVFNVNGPFWSSRYVISVLDAQGNPAMAAIDLSPKGDSTANGMVHDVTYTFTKP